MHKKPSPQIPSQSPLSISTALSPLLDLALKEDIGSGDLTTYATVEPDCVAAARIVAKETVVACGLDLWMEVLNRLAPWQCTDWDKVPDGTTCEPGQVMASIRGPAQALLTGERIAMNLVCHLSGVATITSKFVEAAGDLLVLDTRKTTPGLRAAEKYAVRVGGGRNHRMGLDGGVLIKENHVVAAGSIEAAITMAKNRVPDSVRIQCEVQNFQETRSALSAGADALLLDNMGDEDIRKCAQAAKEKNPEIFVEASGNMTLERVSSLAHLSQFGLQGVSVGKLTHSRPYADLSMLISLDPA